MQCDLYNEMIQQFHDGELEKQKEPLVFTHLAHCSECREFFKTLGAMTSSVQAEITDFPFELDEKMFHKLRITAEKKRSFRFNSDKFPAAIAFVLGLIIILMSLFIIDSEVSYRQDMQLAIKQIRFQNERINLLMNTMPEVRVTSNLSNAVVVQGNMQVIQ